jgi:uncharacterized protein YggT (Ycf19 family)
MHSDMWDTLTNLLLLLFWFRIWLREDRELVFNRFLSPIGRISSTAIDFLRPVLFGTPTRIIAALALVFLLVFRGLLGIGGHLQFGFFPNGDQVLRIAHMRIGSPVTGVVFSLLSFARFLFRLWGLAIIYVYGRSAAFDHATGTLNVLSRPFTDMRAEWRPFFLLAAGILIAGATELTGGIRLDGVHPLHAVVHCAGSALMEWINLIPLIVGLLILLIVGSWVSIFTRSGGMMYFCREWLQVFMGPLRNYPLRVGSIDLTPLIMIFGLRMIHGFLARLLSNSFAAF